MGEIAPAGGAFRRDLAPSVDVTPLPSRVGSVKHLSGTASARIETPIEDCFALLAALEGYPAWYQEVVTAVDVVEYGDDGVPARAETTLHLSYGPISRDLDLLLAVRLSRPGLVQLTHVPRGASSGASFDATWRLQDGDGTRLQLELDATMPLPALVPVGNVGDSFAAGFMQAAVQRLEPGS